MRKFVSIMGLMSLAASSQAHVADIPVAQHVVEHAWLVLALVPLLAAAIPWVMRRR